MLCKNEAISASRTPQFDEIEIQWRVIKNLTAGIYLESKEMRMKLLARLQDGNTLNIAILMSSTATRVSPPAFVWRPETAQE